MPTQPPPHQAHDQGQAQAQADERLEFLSLAAHELRGPLTAVKGYAQLALIAARKDGAFPDRSRRALHAIDHQSSRMADMLAELLDAARIQHGTFEVRPRMMDLSLSVKHIVDQRRLSLEQHTIELDAGREVLVGLWDGPRVEQLVRDLLDNAVRYSPEGGVIAVNIGQAGTNARVCVRDHGIGVPPDERERIFAPFFRGAVAQKRHLSGLGLGLFVGHTVAERLGGRLWLDPLPPDEAGSRFCLELPLTRA